MDFLSACLCIINIIKYLNGVVMQLLNSVKQYFLCFYLFI